MTKFLPALKNTRFRSVVIILGHDQLEATYIAWDQHLKSSLLERIELNSLTQKEMDELVEHFGIKSSDEKECAWRDTQGYPFYVQLWIEEAESGGRSAVTLKRFYDRTTRWMSDKEKECLYLTLFLNRVDKRTLQSMTGDAEEAESVLSWFEREGSVRDTTGDVYRVREYLRSRLIRVHHDLGYTVPSTKGGTAHAPGSRSSYPYDRRVRFDERDRGRDRRVGTPRCSGVLGVYGRMDTPWTAPTGATLYHRSALSPADPGGSAAVRGGLPHAAAHAIAPWALIRDAPVQGDAMDSCLTPRVAEPLAHLGGCALSQCSSRTRTCGGGRTARASGSLTRGRGPRRPTHCGPPFGYDGTARPLPRPHDATEQNTCSSGKHKRHRLKNLLLSNSAVRMLFRSETRPGRVHDKRIADPAPDPLPAGSQRRQDLGCQACTLEGVDIFQPVKKPRGNALTRAQKAGNRKLARRRVRLDHVNSRIKRCRLLTETIRLWKDGIRDMVMAIGSALHHVRVRLTPSWAPMV